MIIHILSEYQNHITNIIFSSMFSILLIRDTGLEHTLKFCLINLILWSPLINVSLHAMTAEKMAMSAVCIGQNFKPSMVRVHMSEKSRVGRKIPNKQIDRHNERYLRGQERSCDQMSQCSRNDLSHRTDQNKNCTEVLPNFLRCYKVLHVL